MTTGDIAYRTREMSVPVLALPAYSQGSQKQTLPRVPG